MTPREIALSICEPWFNGDPCEECKCHKVCTKLVERIEAAIQAERDPETNFGNMAQAIDSTEADHIADANKMVAPVAYVTGFSKGYAVVQPVDRSLLMPVGMALYRSPPNQSEDALGMVEPVAWRYIPSERLRDVVLTSDPSQARLAADYGCEVQPLYPAPPKRDPLTDEQIEFRFGRKPTKYMMFLIRSTERAHDIGGEE